MVVSIGAVASASQGVFYYEKDGYYARDDLAHRQASVWAGRGAADLGLEGPVDPHLFQAVLEGKVPDGSGRRLGRRGKEGDFHLRPRQDLTFSAPKSVSLAALVGSSPRGRGTYGRSLQRSLLPRFIPAWAGNILNGRMSSRFLSVHPRVGGEHQRRVISHIITSGSSPRGRGTSRCGSDKALDGRFIPAWAGNIGQRRPGCGRPPVHPRVGGEHE